MALIERAGETKIYLFLFVKKYDILDVSPFESGGGWAAGGCVGCGGAGGLGAGAAAGGVGAGRGARRGGAVARRRARVARWGARGLPHQIENFARDLTEAP